MLVCVLATPLSIQLPAGGLRKAVGDGPGVCGKPGFWSQPSPALAIGATRGVNPHMEDLCFSLSLHPS